MSSIYYIAWWNVENLFDYENSPRRTEKLGRAIGRDVRGWTPALRDRKIDQIATVIAQMNGGLGPDLLGICEVENQFVVSRLAERIARLSGRKYRVVHADTRDERGIDVAFLFDPSLLAAPRNQRFQHVVMRRTATREIFQVNFRTRRGRTWAVLGNHWPSRSGGPPIASAGYRAVAGETLAYFHERIRKVHGDDTPVLAMGDFNDEPFDASLVQFALSERQRAKVVNARTPRLWNLTWDALGTGEGTYYFNNASNVLDQFLVNGNMATRNSAIQALPDSVEVVRFPQMVETSRQYSRPRAFGGMGKPVDQRGFSDHYPIGMRVEEAD